MIVLVLVWVVLADVFMLAVGLVWLDFLASFDLLLMLFGSLDVKFVELLSSVWLEDTLPEPLPPLSKTLSLSFLVLDGDDREIVDELDELVEDINCLFLYKMPFSSSISSTRLITKFGLSFRFWLLLLLLLRLGCDALDDSILVPMPDSWFLASMLDELNDVVDLEIGNLINLKNFSWKSKFKKKALNMPFKYFSIFLYFLKKIFF